MAQHRVEFMEFTRAALQMFDAKAGHLRQIGEFRIGMRQELVQRRVEQADGDRKARHHLEDRLEIAALFGQQLG